MRSERVKIDRFVSEDQKDGAQNERAQDEKEEIKQHATLPDLILTTPLEPDQFGMR